MAVGVGVLMDVDHLFDCYQRYIKGNLNKTYSSYMALDENAETQSQPRLPSLSLVESRLPLIQAY